MENPVNILKGVICGMIFLAAVAWQLHIYVRCSDFDGKRAALLTFGLPGMLAAAIVALTAIGGISLWILTTIDGRPVQGWPRLTFFGAVLAVCLAFFIKQCFNAALLGATATWTVYQLMFNGELSFIPVFRVLFDFVASAAPAWIQMLYVTLSLGYALTSAIGSTFEWSGVP